MWDTNRGPRDGIMPIFGVNMGLVDRKLKGGSSGRYQRPVSRFNKHIGSGISRHEIGLPNTFPTLSDSIQKGCPTSLTRGLCLTPTLTGIHSIIVSVHIIHCFLVVFFLFFFLGRC
jgi:hypothetical protein